MVKIEDVFGVQEELCAELRSCIEVAGGMTMIRHPLVYSVPHFDVMNGMLNRALDAKKKMVCEATDSRDWLRYVFLHERPHRLQAFLDCCFSIRDDEYWSVLKSVWIDSENIWQSKEIWREIFKKGKEEAKRFMSIEDVKVFEKLPDEFVVYRGHRNNKDKRGLSYTLSLSVAKKFSKRFDGQGHIVERVIKKSDVFAYTNGRKEQEIIYIGR